MSNNRNVRSTKSELEQIRRTFRKRQLEHQRSCEHHSDREYWFEPLSHSKNFRRGDESYPDSTFICTECNKIFDGASFTKEETSDAIWVIEGMLEQIKVMGNLDDEQLEETVAMISALDTIKNMESFYHDLDKKSDRDNRNRRRNGGNHKSSIGVTQSMFNGAGRR